MIENGMVIGDYYDGSDEEEQCEECGQEAEYKLEDGTWLCADCFDEYSEGALTVDASDFMEDEDE